MNGGLVQGVESFVPQEIGAKGELRAKQVSRDTGSSHVGNSVVLVSRLVSVNPMRTRVTQKVIRGTRGTDT